MSATLIGVVTVIYVAVAISLWAEGKPGLAVAFGGYAIANVGLIMEAMK